MGAVLLALTISWAIGWFALELLWPPRTQPIDRVLRAAVAGGLGLFASSLLYFICLLAGIASRPWVVAIDLTVLAALGGWAVLARRGRPLEPAIDEDPSSNAPPAATAIDWILGVGLVAALFTNASAWLLRFRDEPLGFWDAFAIWNLKARFFFFEAGEHWQRAFSDVISWSHTDYPLLLPLNVARLWVYDGSPNAATAVVLSIFFTLLAMGLVFGAIASTKGRPTAFLACFALLATPQLMAQSVWQVADIPVAMFLAGSLALVLAAAQRPIGSAPLLFVAGLSAGAAAWTKNEGLLFALAILISIPLTGAKNERKQRLTNAVQFAKGLALPFILVLSMKLGLGGESDLAADFSLASLGRIFEGARHLMIIESFFRTMIMLTGAPLLVTLIALCFWLGFDRRSGNSGWIAVGGLALALQFAGYYFIYLITDRDLAWHLGTSNLRLFVQLWPSALLLLFTGLRPFSNPEPGTSSVKR
jgi:hypothetical protein